MGGGAESTCIIILIIPGINICNRHATAGFLKLRREAQRAATVCL